MDPRRAVEQGLSLQALFTHCKTTKQMELIEQTIGDHRTRALGLEVILRDNKCDVILAASVRENANYD